MSLECSRCERDVRGGCDCHSSSEVTPEPRMWTFLSGNGREREVGPYRTQGEARASFQWRWGYWPDVAIRVVPFVPQERAS